MGETNRVSVRYIEEVTPGTTPGTPTMQEVLRTGGGFRGLTDVVESQSVRSDRMVNGLYRTGQHAEGSVQFEAAYGQFDDLVEGALYGDWTTPIALSGITYDASTTDDSINDSGSGFVAAGITAGMWLLIAGFTDPANNGLFRVSTVTAGKLTFSAKITLSTGLYGASPNLVTEAAGATVTIRNQGSLRNGTSAHAYTFEQAHLDVNQFFQFRGCYANALSLNLQAKALVTGELGFMGMSFTRSGSTIASVVTPVNSNKAWNTTDNIIGLSEGAGALSDYVQSISLSIENNLYMVDAVGYLNPPEIPAGTQRISGALGIYLGSGTGTLLDKYIDFTQTEHAFAAKDASGNYFIITLPAANYSGETPEAGGLDAQVIANMPFTCFVDSGGDYQVQVDRITTP